MEMHPFGITYTPPVQKKMNESVRSNKLDISCRALVSMTARSRMINIFGRETFHDGAPAEASAGRVHARTYRATHLATRRMGGPPTCVFSLLFLFFPSLVSLSPRCHGQASPAGDLPGRRRHGNQPIRLPSARSARIRPRLSCNPPRGAATVEPFSSRNGTAAMMAMGRHGSSAEQQQVAVKMVAANSNAVCSKTNYGYSKTTSSSSRDSQLRQLV